MSLIPSRQVVVAGYVTGMLLKSAYVSWFSSVDEAKPNYEIEVSWLGLANLLTNPHKRRITADERAVPLISFARFDGMRCNDNVQAITAVDLSFDGTAKYETIRRFAAEYDFIAYSGHGHTSEKPKFRLIFPLTRDIALDEWPKMQAVTNAMFGNKADGSTRDGAHIFAVPSTSAKKRDVAFAHHNHGRFLDPDLLLSSNSLSRPLSALSTADFAAIV